MYLIFKIVVKPFNSLFEMGDHDGPELVAYIKLGRAVVYFLIYEYKVGENVSLLCQLVMSIYWVFVNE